MRLPHAPFVLALALLGAGSVRATDLFDGKTLDGWKLVTPSGADIAQVCKVTPDGTIAVAGKPVGYLQAPGEYRNFKLHVEWRWPKDASPKSNSGILLFVGSGPAGETKTWPMCFQVQMKIRHAGDLLPMEGAKFSEALSTPPGAKTPQLDMKAPSSEKPFGEWNSADIVCKDGSIECAVNGVLQNKVTGCSPDAGRIALQLEGTPYELRHISYDDL